MMHCQKFRLTLKRIVVTADGEELTSEPAEVLPLAQRYYLF